jgi:hypothetical protein
MTLLNKGNSVGQSASQGEFDGQSRLSIMTLKIAEGKAFSLGAKGELGQIYGLKVTDDKWPWKMDYAYEVGGKKIGNISVTKLFKDQDFGGGAGSGGGAEVTAITECLQCYYIAAAYKLGRTLEDNDVSIDPKTNKSKLFKYENLCDTDRTLENCLKNNPKAWSPDVYMEIANAVYKSDTGKRFKGDVYLHRGSKFMDAVYLKKKRCMLHDKDAKKKSGSAALTLAPATFSNDKWNPGDVWMTTQTNNVPFPDSVYAVHDNGGKKGQHACDWPTLKSVVRTAARLGVTVGISLKKPGASASVKEFNTDSDDFKNVAWNGFRFGKKGDFFSSSDMYVNMGNAEIQFRSFNTTKAWQGEIKGLAAAGGKVGGGSVQYYIEKHISERASIGSSAGHGWKEGNIKSAEKAYELYTDYNELQKGATGKVETLEWEEFEKKWKSSSAGFRFSKGMNLLFLEAVKGGTSQGIKSFAGDLFRYASSSTDQSSYFIKVS